MSQLVAEVIAIGDELTTGQRLDTNSRWLSQRLTELGALVRYHTTVADDLTANVAVFRTAAERAQLVVATGGLGPTADDLTRDALAEAAGVALVEDAAALAAIEERFRSRGRAMPPRNRRQALFPDGATPIANAGGTAPGVAMTLGACRVFALPGVPAELKPMWDASVAPQVAPLCGEQRVTRHMRARCFGAGESHIEQMLGDLIARGREPLVGITASKATITLRVTASAGTEEACWEAMRPTVEQIRETLGSLIFAWEPIVPGRDDDGEITLQDYVVALLAKQRLAVSTTEGVTHGQLAHWLAEADARGRETTGGSVIGRCVYDAIAPDSDIERRARDLAGEGCGILIGETNADGKIPVAVATPRGVVARDVTLVGHDSIHCDLVTKHALNLLRLQLESDAAGGIA